MYAPLTAQSSQVDKLGMVGVNGNKFPEIRTHLQNNIAQVYNDLDVSYVIWSYVNGDVMAHGTFLSASIASQEKLRQIQRLVCPILSWRKFIVLTVT
jgi:hypothetical protein